MFSKDIALLVVDLQNDFCDHPIVAGEKSAALSCPGAHKVAAAIPTLAKKYSCVIASQDWHINPGDHFARWGEHCIQYTFGAQLCSHLDGVTWQGIIRKGQYDAGYSAFSGKIFQSLSDRDDQQLCQHSVADYLKNFLGINTLHIVGVALDHCVAATALDASKAGFTTKILLDYTAATSKEVYNYFRSQAIYNCLSGMQVDFVVENFS